jgi:hypothetical protein
MGLKIEGYQMKIVLFILLLILIPEVTIAHEDTSPEPLVSQNSESDHIKIVVQGNYRFIYSNGIPNHSTGSFPNAHNPNAIAPQQYNFRVPLYPTIAKNITPLGRPPLLFGVAVNGIPFDPGTAEFWNNDGNSGWQYEALSGKINLGVDKNNAHVQPGGAYHYHGLPTGLINQLSKGKGMTLIGYAADGFPIYASSGYADPKNPNSRMREMRSSYRLRTGQRSSGPGGKYDGTFVQDYEYVAGAGDLDECNGRFSVTPEYPKGIYQYHITANYPFIPRCFHGIPDESFHRRPPNFQQRFPQNLPPRRPPFPPPPRF